MEIDDNARKHRVADLDIEHAVCNVIRVLNQGDRDLYIGSDTTGRLVEVVVLDDDGEPVAIHDHGAATKVLQSALTARDDDHA